MVKVLFVSKLLDKLGKSELIKGFGLSTFWGMMSKFIMFLVTFYCSNVLTQEGFGEFSYIKNTLDVTILICATNFSSLAIKFAAESMTSQVSLKRLYILILFTVTVSIVISICILFIPYNIIESYTKGESVAYFIKILAVLLPFFTLYPFVNAILRGFKQFSLVGKLEVFLSLIYFIFIVLFSNVWGYKGAVYALISYYLLFFIVGVTVIMRYNAKVLYLVKVDELFSQLKCVKLMILPVFFMSFIEVPVTWFVQTEVARKATYSIVASLSVIMTVRTIIQILPTYFYQAFIPFVTILNAKKLYNEYFKKTEIVFKYLVVLCVILLPILLFFGRFILSLFNDMYVDSFPSYVISILIIPFILFSALFNINMIVREHQVSMVTMSIIGSVCFLGGFYLFINLGVDVLESFFISQGLQYFVRMFYAVCIYKKDKIVCLR